MNRVPNALPLSSEDTVSLIQQHLRCKRAGWLSVLVVTAAFKAAKIRRFNNEQGGPFGDIQISIPSGHKMVTRCEMKNKTVQQGDIDRALQKIAAQGKHVQNYIFITTEPVTDDVREYARSKYDETGGVEIAILDCVGFLRHFLHLFHRLRKDFLDQYQVLVLKEHDSAVSQALKEAFLALRQAAESAD
ncbi:MAG TPA: restriction endonuclease, SacI family [Verrucomicrobiae bacterium]|nr:restriction endonuclease, SacI family [Verrucomicrobiae bacterium]